MRVGLEDRHPEGFPSVFQEVLDQVSISFFSFLYVVFVLCHSNQNGVTRFSHILGSTLATGDEVDTVLAVYCT